MHQRLVFAMILLASSLACGSPDPITDTSFPPSSHTFDDLRSSRWLLSSGVPSGVSGSTHAITLTVGEKGSVVGQAPINTYRATDVARDDGSWSFVDPILTNKVDVPLAMDLEKVYLGLLARADGWRLDNGALELTDGGRILLRFEPADGD